MWCVLMRGVVFLLARVWYGFDRGEGFCSRAGRAAKNDTGDHPWGVKCFFDDNFINIDPNARIMTLD